MKSGQASQTAVMVCLARAIADRAGISPRFRDPTAAALLPESARAELERFQWGAPRSMSERILHGRATMMVARTVAIDDAVRERRFGQVVILGAGLDGRAWRMPELRDAVVFEVDHADSQREKRARVDGLSKAAKEIRFVGVDFTRDDLGAALESAGHDPREATMWIWEGVVMYLTRAEAEATLRVIQSRSAPGSRLAVAYHAPARRLFLVGLFLRRVGEPLKAAYSEAQLRAAPRDVRLRSEARSIDPERLAQEVAPAATQLAAPIKHHRVAIADRA